MARQLRIEFPGAFYHITSRGNQKNPIFFCDHDRSAFLDYCQGAHDKYGALIHCYCLMDNHYHLLLETPCGNLSQIMHFINASYSIFFNTKHSRVGHFLQGRFKAILIQADSYAQELSRYVHLNPVRAEIVRNPGDYPWSSYREFMGQRSPARWLSTALIMSYFGSDLNLARTRYAAYVAEALGRTIKNPLRDVGPCLILGGADFISRIKKTFLLDKAEDREVPAIRGLKKKMDLTTIQSTVEQTLGIKNKFTRNVTIFLCRNHTDLTLKEIAEHFQVSKSAIGKIVNQMRTLLAKDRTLRKAVKEDEERLFHQK